VDITTMNFIGKPRVSRMKLGELYPVKERFGLVNWKRDLDGVKGERKWWMGKKRCFFGVYEGMSKVREKEVWEGVRGAVEKNRKD
jgi:hypothetical protein